MRCTLLGSGSCGNAMVVETESTRVLVDAGLSFATMKARWDTAHPNEALRLDAIVLTHAHGDHTGHASSLARKLDVPVYLTESTRRGVRLRQGVRTRVFGKNAPFAIGDVEISPCPVPHDAPQVALTFSAGGKRAGLVTDLGEVPAGLADHLKGSDVVFAESNHDLEMLERGPYARALKRRVGSAVGHLANDQCAELLAALAPTTRRFVLMHLSAVNNTPGVALAVAAQAVARHGRPVECAPRETPFVVDLRRAPRAVQLSFELGVEQRSPESIEQRSPESIEQRSPESVEQRSPESIEQRSPESIEQRSPQSVAPLLSSLR